MFGVVVLAMTAALAASSGIDASAAPKKPSAGRAGGAGELKTLRRQHRALSSQINTLGEEIIRIDTSLDMLAAGQEDARRRLADHLAQAYRAGHESVGAQILGSDSASEAADRTRILLEVSRYEKRMLAEIEQADLRAEADRTRRDVLVGRMVALQRKRNTIGRRILRIQDRIRARQETSSSTVADLVAAQQGATAGGGMTGYPSGMTPWVPTPSAGGYPVSQPAPQPSPTLPAPTTTSPPSAASIDAYLQSKGSKMAGQGFFFMLSGTRYGIDPRLLVAISGAESSFGQQLCGPFNAWGWSCPGNPAAFGSWAAGIETVTRGLKIGYIDQGLTSVPAINGKYAPIGAGNDPTNLNSNWTTNVSRFLAEQGGNPANVLLPVQQSGFGGGSVNASLVPGT